MDRHSNPLLRRLRRFAALTPDDEAFLIEITRGARHVPAGQDLTSQGERPSQVHVILQGLACRYKLLADGRRQIMAFLVPGDPCDLQVRLLRQMDHAVATLAPSLVAVASAEQIEEATLNRPLLVRAFWYSTLLDEAILREWLVNIGQRTAYERIAHLLWELFLRHAVVGLADADGMSFELPLTQRELADSLGLSAVHVNRVLQRLRAEGMVENHGKRLAILRPEGLRRVAGFDADYLHLGTGWTGNGDEASARAV